jgi:hypothetical protein
VSEPGEPRCLVPDGVEFDLLVRHCIEQYAVARDDERLRALLARVKQGDIQQLEAALRERRKLRLPGLMV